MRKIFKEFRKNLEEADGRPVFIKNLKSYLDYLNQFDYNKRLEALEEEIQALKSKMEEIIQIKMAELRLCKSLQVGLINMFENERTILKAS